MAEAEGLSSSLVVAPWFLDEFPASAPRSDQLMPNESKRSYPVAGLTVLHFSNNHMAYAVQWFLFAATALVIYAVALRRRMRG